MTSTKLKCFPVEIIRNLTEEGGNSPRDWSYFFFAIEKYTKLLPTAIIIKFDSDAISVLCQSHNSNKKVWSKKEERIADHKADVTQYRTLFKLRF